MKLTRLCCIAFCLAASLVSFSSYASAIDEALNDFGNQLDQLRNKAAQLQLPTTKSKPVFDPAAAKIQKAPGSPQDYVSNRVPIGTEVRVTAFSLGQVLAAPSINADSVINCVSLAQNSSLGKEVGRLVVDDYASSDEDTARMKSISNDKFKGSFTAMWAKVHHVVFKSKDYLGRDNTSSNCRGWLRIDSMELFHPGTGPYSSSRLHEWATLGLTPTAKNTSRLGTVVGPENMPRWSTKLTYDLHGRNFLCMLDKGDSVRIIDPNLSMALNKMKADPQFMKAKVSVIKARTCAVNTVGYVEQRYIQ